MWQTKIHKEASGTVFIEGLPGIGNVGKVVVDFLIEQSKAELAFSYFSTTLPNSVFVNEDNLVQLPEIAVYKARIGTHDVLLMTGDVQPSDEVSSYEFCELVISSLKRWGVKDIITLGGIGLHEAPSDPQVYCVGNLKGAAQRFVDAGASDQVYGVVGPIIGVSGVLLGLAQKEGLSACALLAETFGHPMYLGLRGAKATLQVLYKVLGFSYSLSSIEEELEELEEEDGESRNPRIDTINKLKRFRDTNYIG